MTMTEYKSIARVMKLLDIDVKVHIKHPLLIHALTDQVLKYNKYPRLFHKIFLFLKFINVVIIALNLEDLSPSSNT
jgi:hypothetical protein